MIEKLAKIKQNPLLPYALATATSTLIFLNIVLSDPFLGAILALILL